MAKVAFITGATRGIGKACAMKLAQEGWDIAVAAKSVEENPRIPGTIFTAAEEIAQFGTRAFPVQCNVRDLDSVRQAAEATLNEFGRIDAVINNAGALWWKPMLQTPMSKFDLIMEVNARGAFAVTAAFLPTMKEQDSGHVIVMSPPISTEHMGGRIAYWISKYGMTMIAHGLAEEFADSPISATALWPKTLVESYATKNFNIGGPEQWRKADILADATFEILQRPAETKGKALIDEDFLRSIGYTDFSKYNVVEDGQPIVIHGSEAPDGI
jgi:citronellol/citronellal dehydrogenase